MNQKDNVTTPVTLPEHEVHLWCAVLQQFETDLQPLMQTLSEDEQVRANRFRFDRDRSHFIIARGLLRRILSRYLGLHPAALKFVYSQYGKPSLSASDNWLNLQFNVSHSNGLALFALTQHRQIGVDVEWIRAMPDVNQIVSRFFTEGEKIAFSKLSATEKEAAFFRVWTFKEAYLKAIGSGLFQSLNQVEIVFDLPTSIGLRVNGEEMGDRWFLQTLEPAAGYAAALAVEGETIPIKYWDCQLD